jgi:thioredoxin 1
MFLQIVINVFDISQYHDILMCGFYDQEINRKGCKMGNCTVCPFIRYWYVVIAIIVIVWAVQKFIKEKSSSTATVIAGVEDLNEQSFPDALSKAGVLLIDFWAPWCGPCKAQMPIIAETVPSLPQGVRIAKVNIDEKPNLTERYKVSGVPTWIVFRNGKEIHRVSGVQSKENLLQLAEMKGE